MEKKFCMRKMHLYVRFYATMPRVTVLLLATTIAQHRVP